MNNEELILQMLGKISDKLEEHDKHFESIDNHFESIDNRFESIDNRFESLETDVRHTRMLIEKQEHNVQLIAEQYGDISAKLERVREIDELRDRVRTLETVVRNHTVSIKELRRAKKKQKGGGEKAARSFMPFSLLWLCAFSRCVSRREKYRGTALAASNHIS